jgi:hypothetical protein
MFYGFPLNDVASEPKPGRPYPRINLTLEGISGRMFSERSCELKEFRALLQHMDECGTIMPRISDQYSNDDWQPIVHAQLILLEAMHNRQYTFYNNDKFVACSKAACFCCYHYICNHPGGFARPACHKKVYLNWKPPSLFYATGDEEIVQQRDVMNELIDEVRNPMVDRVLRQRSIAWHSNSSTGITLSVIQISESQPSSSSAEVVFVSELSGQNSEFVDNVLDPGSSDDDDDDGGISLL